MIPHSGFLLLMLRSQTGCKFQVKIIIYYLLSDSEVITGKSQTKAIARSIHQGRGLRFPCNDRTGEVNKLQGVFIIWPFLALLLKNAIKHRK